MQSIVVEFILTHVDQLFGDTALSGECPPAQHVTASRESRQSCRAWEVTGSVSHFADEKTEARGEGLELQGQPV